MLNRELARTEIFQSTNSHLQTILLCEPCLFHKFFLCHMQLKGFQLHLPSKKKCCVTQCFFVFWRCKKCIETPSEHLEEIGVGDKQPFFFQKTLFALCTRHLSFTEFTHGCQKFMKHCVKRPLKLSVDILERGTTNEQFS